MSIAFEELVKFRSIKVNNRWYWEKAGKRYEAFVADDRVYLKEVMAS